MINRGTEQRGFLLLIGAADDAPAQEVLRVTLGLDPAAPFPACFACPAAPWLVQLMAGTRKQREECGEALETLRAT